MLTTLYNNITATMTIAIVTMLAMTLLAHTPQ